MAREYEGTEVITQKVTVFWDVESDWILITIDDRVYYVGAAESYNTGSGRLSEALEDSAAIILQ